VNIINPDVYNYANSFNLYPDEIKTFLAGGSKAGGREERAIAWGIVPNDEASLKKETVFSLRDRLEEVIAPVTRKGIPFRQLLENSLITPSCGLSSMSIQGAESALEMLADLSRELKRKYFGELT
jgi:methionine synthase II (cobalamin-independent)